MCCGDGRDELLDEEEIVAKRKVSEDGEQDAAAAERIGAMFRLVNLGGEPTSDVRTARLVASDQGGDMIGEINVVVDTPDVIRLLGSGNGLFWLEITPAAPVE